VWQAWEERQIVGARGRQSAPFVVNAVTASQDKRVTQEDKMHDPILQIQA
jgi:hypothetical protein